MKLHRSISLLILAIAPLVGAQAMAGEYWNLNAPGFDDPGDGSRLALVRKSDATLWKKVTTPCCGNWIKMTAPFWGTAGNLTGVAMGSPTQNFIFTQDTGGVKHSVDGGANWLTTFGSPGGVMSSTAAAGIPGGEGNIVVILNGKPWWRRRLSDGTLLAWTQVGSTNMIAAPGVAMTDWRTDVFGVKQGGTVAMTTCQYPTCFSSTSTWTDLPGKSTLVQANAVWFDDPNGFGPFLAVVIKASDDNKAWVNTYDNFSGTWGGWVSRGGNLSSAVQIAKPGAGSTSPRLIARANDGTGNILVNNSGTTWTSIGHP